MSSSNSKTQSNSSNNNEAKNDIRWEDLKIHFRLKERAFTDNKISGMIKVEPEKARKLIEHFKLFVNGSERLELPYKTSRILVSGFDPTRENSSIYITAKSREENKSIESEHRTFFIMRQSFSVTPALIFDWSSWTDDNPTVNLIVKWFHIGDRIAQKYVLRLDGKEIYFIREPSIGSAYKVCINSFKPNTSHTLQIIARLNNNKETYLSEPIKFTVPEKKGKDDIEIINVFPISDTHDDWEAFITDDDEQTNEKPSVKEKLSSPKDKNLSSNANNHFQSESILSCGCSGPHEDFPGVDHFTNIDNKKPVSQNKSIHNHKRSSVQDNKSISSVQKDMSDNKNGAHNKNDEEYDDNNDVCYSNDIPTKK